MGLTSVAIWVIAGADILVVSREEKSPHFQTVFACFSRLAAC
jgi:hypothetical protein